MVYQAGSSWIYFPIKITKYIGTIWQELIRPRRTQWRRWWWRWWGGSGPWRGRGSCPRCRGWSYTDTECGAESIIAGSQYHCLGSHSPRSACPPTSDSLVGSPGPRRARLRLSWPRCCRSSRDHQWRSPASICASCQHVRTLEHLSITAPVLSSYHVAPLVSGQPRLQQEATFVLTINLGRDKDEDNFRQVRLQTSFPFPEAPSHGKSSPFTPSHL